MKYIKDEDLEFLEHVKSRDLNKLVEILTKTKTEELTKRDIYQEFKGDHHQYWEEIAAELQYFGGNTIANILRRRGVKYSEILKDVCQTLKIDIDNESIINENMLNKIWNKALKVDYPLLTQAFEDKLLNFIKSSNQEDSFKNIKQQVSSLKNKDTMLALVTIPGFLLKRISDPAYRVTIEAVCEIARLRRQYESVSQSLVLENQKAKKLPLRYSESLLVMDNDGEELGELKIIEAESIDDIDFIENNSEEIDRTKQFLADAFTGIITTPNQTVELVFSPEVQKGLANGTYKLLENRAIVVNTKSGAIKEHAEIFSSGKGKQLLTGGYQLLSIAVAQSHLADIEKSLSSIKSLVTQIQEKLEAEDRAQIEGSIDYIVNIVDFIRINDYKIELKQQKKQKIEDIILDVLKWKNKILIEFQNLNNEINNVDNKDSFGTKNTFDELKKLLKIVEPLKYRYELILKLSSLLSIIKKLIDPFEEEFSNVEIKLNEFEEKINDYNRCINKQKEKLKAYFNLDDTLEERKKIIDILQNKNRQDLKNLHFDYEKRMQTIETYFNKINNGKSSIVFLLDDNANIDRYAINMY